MKKISKVAWLKDISSQEVQHLLSAVQPFVGSVTTSDFCADSTDPVVTFLNDVASSYADELDAVMEGLLPQMLPRDAVQQVTMSGCQERLNTLQIAASILLVSHHHGIISPASLVETLKSVPSFLDTDGSRGHTRKLGFKATFPGGNNVDDSDLDTLKAGHWLNDKVNHYPQNVQYCLVEYCASQ